MPRAPLLSSSMAVCTASVVTPAPPTAGRKVKICASVASGLVGGLATRAQVRTSSTGGTGLTRKSATRICISRRATTSSKLCVMATTGGQAPIRSIRRSSACSSASSAASTSTTTTVAPATSIWSSRSASRPLMTSRPICGLAANVARTDSSKSWSAVSTTTLAAIAGVMDRLIRMTSSSHGAGARHCAGALAGGDAPPVLTVVWLMVWPDWFDEIRLSGSVGGMTLSVR